MDFENHEWPFRLFLALGFPKLIRVADGALHVDGWRFPISMDPDAVVWYLLDHLKSWHKQSGDHDWIGSITSLLIMAKLGKDVY